MSNFRKLDVYNKSLQFVDDIYKLSKQFPDEERFSLTNQLKRAATSVCLNIAEGSGRYHKKDFAQFLRVSLGSSLECSALLDIALKLSYISDNEHAKFIEKCAEISKMLNGLISSLSRNQELTTSN